MVFVKKIVRQSGVTFKNMDEFDQAAAAEPPVEINAAKDSNLEDYLTSWGLAMYIDKFKEHSVDLDILQILSAEDRKELVPVIGHRAKLTSQIAMLKDIITVAFCDKNTTEILTINDLIKTSGVGRKRPVLELPFFTHQPSICPAQTLSDYINKTSTVRPNQEDKLILTFKKPHHAATSQSISRWLKQTLEQCGVDTTVFSGHSTRHASTSAAKRAGVSIDVIRQCAGWSNQSVVFANFYNRPVSDSNYANAVFNVQ